jgi:hypothetical protein
LKVLHGQTRLGAWIVTRKKKDRATVSSSERKIRRAAKELIQQSKTQLKNNLAGELQLACGQG